MACGTTVSYSKDPWTVNFDGADEIDPGADMASEPAVEKGGSEPVVGKKGGTEGAPGAKYNV